MKIVNVQCESFRIEEAKALDPITVIMFDYGSGKGKIVVECYGSAWSGYWGAMGESLRSFISSCNVDYLCGSMRPSDRAMTKRESAYLLRIMTAVKEAMKEQAHD